MDKSNIFKIPLFITIFLAIILTMHYSSIEFNIEELFGAKKISEIKKDLDNASSEISNLKQEVNESNNKIKLIKQDLEKIKLDSLEMYTQISVLKILCGRSDVRGPGITIRVADNISDDEYFNINDKIVHDLDVRMIINQLNRAGAEAIAVNGKRIVNTTEVICIGPVLRINGEAVAAPFIIKAIGDPDILMEEAITSQESYAYDLKTNFGIDIKAMKNYDINISKNIENIEVNFAKLYEEGE